MTSEQKSLSWWHTLPGMITAVASLLAAIAGLVVAFNQLRDRSVSQLPNELGSATFRGIVSLPPSDLAKLRTENGDMLWADPDGNAISATVYNGSLWTLKQVTLHVRLTDDTNEEVIFDGDIVLPLDSNSTGEPFKTSDFYSARVFRQFKGTGSRSHNLGITGAYGVRTDPK